MIQPVNRFMRLEWEGVVKRKSKTGGKLIAGEIKAKTQEHSMSTYKAQPCAEAPDPGRQQLDSAGGGGPKGHVSQWHSKRQPCLAYLRNPTHLSLPPPPNFLSTQEKADGIGEANWKRLN